MKNSLHCFKTAFIAEHIKKKDTGIYTLSIIIGALSPVILLISRLNGSQRHIPEIHHNLYFNFIENALELFAYYMLPFLIILIAIRIAYLDHRNNGWRLMESLPVNKYAIYFSKFFILIISNIIAITTFLVLSVLFVYFLSVVDIVPANGILELSYSFVFNLMLRLIVASLFLSAFQYVLSVRFSNFLWPIFIGVIGFGFSTFLNEVNVVVDWFPYSPISNIYNHPEGSSMDNVLTYMDYMSFIGCIMLLYIGYQWFKNKNIISVISGSRKQALQTLIMLLILGSLFIFLKIPKQLSPHNRTVITGTIESNKAFSNFYIIEPFINDTIAEIPVVGNSFCYYPEKIIDLNNYNIAFDDNYRTKVFFGENDSVQLNVIINEKYKKAQVRGTRLVENQVKNGSDSFSYSSLSYMLNNKISSHEKSILFLQLLKEEWQAEVNDLLKYKTVDNYSLRDDYIALKKELIYIKYRQYYNEYKKRFKNRFPKKQLEIPIDLQVFEKPIGYTESLLNNDVYLFLVLEQLAKKNTKQIDRNSKILEETGNLEDESFKNKLLYWQLSESINEASTGKEIDQLLNSYGSLMSDVKLRDKIIEKGRIVKLLSKEMDAPGFDAETVNGQIVTVEDLRGKYAVIDVWATWCAPCRKDAPYFEKYALKYQDDMVKFVSLSVDSNKENWEIEVSEMTNSILQLWALDGDKFMYTYNINTIPRYMVIDPSGEIVNLDLPRPSKPGFEIILRKALNME